MTGKYIYNTVRISLNPMAHADSAPYAKSETEALRVCLMLLDDLDDDQEHGIVIALDNALRVVGFKVFTSGTETACIFDPKRIFRTALALGASRIILSHNHPGLSTDPSPEDIAVTKRIQDGGKLIGVPLLDHLIIGQHGHSSMKSAGHMP